MLEVEWATMSGGFGSDRFAMDSKWRDVHAFVQRALYNLQIFNDLELFRACYHIGVTTLKVTMAPKTAAFDPALYDGFIYRVSALLGVKFDTATTRAALYRFLKTINWLFLVMVHFSAYDSRANLSASSNAAKVDSDFAADAFARGVHVRMYSTNIFINLWHRDGDTMMAIVCHTHR